MGVRTIVKILHTLLIYTAIQSTKHVPGPLSSKASGCGGLKEALFNSDRRGATVMCHMQLRRHTRAEGGVDDEAGTMVVGGEPGRLKRPAADVPINGQTSRQRY